MWIFISRVVTLWWLVQHTSNSVIAHRNKNSLSKFRERFSRIRLKRENLQKYVYPCEIWIFISRKIIDICYFGVLSDILRFKKNDFNNDNISSFYAGYDCILNEF